MKKEKGSMIICRKCARDGSVAAIVIAGAIKIDQLNRKMGGREINGKQKLFVRHSVGNQSGRSF